MMVVVDTFPCIFLFLFLFSWRGRGGIGFGGMGGALGG